MSLSVKGVGPSPSPHYPWGGRRDVSQVERLVTDAGVRPQTRAGVLFRQGISGAATFASIDFLEELERQDSLSFGLSPDSAHRR